MKQALVLLAALALLVGCGGNASAADAPVPTVPAFAPADPAADAPVPEPTPDPNRPMVALTFDDGPTSYTPQVLDLLERYGAKGTFFVIGRNLDEETKPVLQRMADLGCDIGMHDLTHTDLTRLSYAGNVKRIQRMRALIFDQIDGGYETHLLRPPFGSLNKTVRRALRSADAASIRWSVDTLDWRSKDPGAILKIVKAQTRDGAILLFHDRLPSTVAALRKAIPWLQEQGYELVTVTELIESSGQSIRYGEDYRCKPGR